MRLSRLAIAAPLFQAHFALAEIRQFWWNVTYAQTNPDGNFERRVIGVNNTWPPPPIEVTSDDTLLLHVFNGLDVPTAIHHHGMFFSGKPEHDGALAVTQCGIPPGQWFTYEVPIESSRQWGTYWIHAHAGGQYVDGLRSPFIVHNARGEVHASKYDDEFGVVLGDWYYEQHDVLLERFLSKANPTGAEPVPDTGLIYFTHKSKYLPSFNHHAKLAFEPGKTYRLRLINTSAFASFWFWIEGHTMRVIEADGTDVEEFETSLLEITAAQRYSILVTARSDTRRNYYIHADMDLAMFDDIPEGYNPNITSVISYSDQAPTVEPQTIDEYVDFDDLKLVPVVPEPLEPADRKIKLEVVIETMDNGINRAMFNGITYNPPLVPSLYTQLSMGKDALNPVIYGPNSFVLEYNQVIELTIVNGDDGKHPFHLHGHKFSIVNRSYNVSSSDLEENPSFVEGQPNPLRRDTVQVPGNGATTVRFRSDNPGAWIFHCHIEWHLESGLAVVFNSAPLKVQETISLPPWMYKQCEMLSTPYTGNAAGHNSTTDFSGLPVGPFRQELGWHAKGITALLGCMLTAIVGMTGVGWYAFGDGLTDDEVEEAIRAKARRREARGGKFKWVWNNITALSSRSARR